MSKHKGIPPGWKMTTFGQIMPQPHWTAFLELWNKYDGDMDAVMKALRAYLQPFKAEFAARGADVDFLSYFVPFKFNEVVQQQEKQQQAEQAVDSHDIADQIMRDMNKPKPPSSQWN